MTFKKACDLVLSQVFVLALPAGVNFKKSQLPYLFSEVLVTYQFHRVVAES